MKQELFYVAASRGREEIAVITSDAAGLAESVGVSMARPSAIDLANQIPEMSKRPSNEQGIDRTPSLPAAEKTLDYGIGLAL
jgi:hypothetical protein